MRRSADARHSGLSLGHSPRHRQRREIRVFALHMGTRCPLLVLDLTGTSVLLKKAAGVARPCRSSSHYITSRTTNTTDRSTSALRPSACGPAPHTRTPILSYSLKVTPTNHFVNWQQDPQGNWLARFVFPEKATELKIEVDFSAQMTVVNPFDFFVEPYAAVFRFHIPTISRPNSRRIWRPSEQGPLFAAYLKDIPRQADSTVNFLVDLNAQLQKKVGYVIRMEPGIQTPEETLASRLRIVPRLRLAVDPGFPASRARGAFRLRLSHPAPSRHRSGRRPARGRERFHRSARLGRSLSAGGRVDRLRRHLGHADGRGAHSRRRHAALSLGGADLGQRRLCQCRIRLRDERQAHPRGAADHAAVLRRILVASRQVRRSGRCRSERRTTCG